MTGRTHCRRRSNRERPAACAALAQLVEENLVRTAQTEPAARRNPAARPTVPCSKPDDHNAGDPANDQPAEQAPQPIPAELVAADASSTGAGPPTARAPDLARARGQTNRRAARRIASARRNSDAPTSRPGGVVTLTSANQPPKSGLARFLGGAQPQLDEAVKQSACSIDPAERRLIDFKLPDLSGKMVSLHDIDADVILLDFWGSWCQPCRKSIPHLIELQKKLAGKRVQVIGIACEKAAAAARSAGQCRQSRRASSESTIRCCFQAEMDRARCSRRFRFSSTPRWCS